MKILFLLVSLATINCSSKENSLGPSPTATPTVASGPLKPLTKIGESQMGRFSPDGTKIIFQSRMRPSHKGSQIYSITLATLKEKRITYNDGDDFSPSYDSTGKFILYSSTTDEMKEHPDLTSPNLTATNPSEIIDPRANFEEIYQSESDGSHIKRLTQSVGFDGNASPSPDGRHTVFVSQRSGNFELYLMDAKGHAQNRILKSMAIMARPNFSPNGKQIVFESRVQGRNAVQIQVIAPWGKSPTPVTAKEAINRDPSWSPDGKRLLFASNREKENIFSIYIVNVDGTCLKRITTSPPPQKGEVVADLFPSLSPDGKKLVYSSNRTGTYQLYLQDFEEPKDCLDDRG